ncbi:MAG TPA: carbon starvation CstA family protein [Verrucomicrobiae bacterium]|nr:carbon starvation CstA family protein [Verrucomicrobiae bacterium]
MKNIVARFLWLVVAALGAWAFLVLCSRRGEDINSIYILTAALCSYAIGYRFYSKWIAARVLLLDDRRATPCQVHDDGKDFVKTNKWIVFGHHFAAISGPGPLVGPVLAAQFGYLPGTLWILIGVVLGGAVQDFVILFCSLRRDGRSLGQMVKDELNSSAGLVALLAILSILIILLAVLALVVVNTLAESPWGVFTVGATIPIAIFMGCYMRGVRVGKVFEASVIGVVLLLLAVWGGQWVYQHPAWAGMLSVKAEPLAWGMIVYGFAASVLPIWLLLAPRDYLSTFMKLGTIFMLALGILVLLPKIHMPALTPFGASGTGPVFAGKLFPFCFITIACGAISGFHSLVASGTTPKILAREKHARSIGYGAMCLESLVAIMALIAACSLEPGVYFSMNMKGAPVDTVAKVSALGYDVSVEKMDSLASTVGEKTLFGRVGGAPTLAVGMAAVFGGVVSGVGLDLWYHFAIMFEALFILTTLDAGTRVGRYLLQDLLGQIWKPLGETRRTGPAWLASFLIVAAWGWFLIQGVRDPLGGINSLWPLFGIANQLLAAIALCLATTVILKMQLQDSASGRPIYAWITLVPLIWLLTVTITAGAEKIWHPSPKIGFLAAAGVDAANPRLHFNWLLDAAVTGCFLLMILAIVTLSVREWILLLARQRISRLSETAPVWLPTYAVAEARPRDLGSLLLLALLLAREWSGQAAVDRAQERACGCAETKQVRVHAYLQVTQKRFDGINRCC